MFRDHFSAHAGRYAEFRPDYPEELFRWLARHTERHDLALDCATGNGQAATGLAAWYARVVATDASAEQIRHARPHARIEYRVAPAERSGLAPRSADLVTVAQALHWLDQEAFFGEATRVLRPGGLVAAWAYGPPRIEPELDAILDDYYTRVVGPWWPPERRIVDDELRSVVFPFDEIDAPRFAIERDWPLDALIGYVGTWSATRRLAESSGRDPTIELSARLAARWGSPESGRLVRWPVFMRAGRPRQREQIYEDFR